jgi:hypothetical protein
MKLLVILQYYKRTTDFFPSLLTNFLRTSTALIWVTTSDWASICNDQHINISVLGNLKGRVHLGDGPNIKINLTQTDCVPVNWIALAQIRK